ncbi:MAG: hypothetical protein WCF17_19070 [Terracidiphilus sp.]
MAEFFVPSCNENQLTSVPTACAHGVVFALPGAPFVWLMLWLTHR